jgi:hypothetical protein
VKLCAFCPAENPNAPDLIHHYIYPLINVSTPRTFSSLESKLVSHVFYHNNSFIHKIVMFVTAAVRVKIYWPGKVPEWANEHKEKDAFDKVFTRQDEDTSIVRKDDRRLRHLAECRINNYDEVVTARADADHRSLQQAEIVSTIEELELEEQDEDAMVERRRILKEKLLLQREQEEVLPWDEEEVEEESECDEESD